MPNPGTVKSGVPQGSILCLLLFLIYVNDMASSIDRDCKLILYANDSAIIFCHKNPDFISEKLFTVLKQCSNWLVDNNLLLHLGKTECILFGSKKKLTNVQDFHIECNGHTIHFIEKVKYLGIFIDHFFEW